MTTAGSGLPRETLTLAEQLTRQFYAWEVRGRGWQLWDLPVELEPPFVPFLRDTSISAASFDDGRRPLLGFLGRALASLFQVGRENAPLQQEGSDEPQAETREEGPDSEIQVVLPKELSPSLGSLEQLTLNLPWGPHAFELIGTPEKVFLQFVASGKDTPAVVQQLKVHFPGAVLVQERASLATAWEGPGVGLVVDFGLSEEFVRPLELFGRLEPDPLAGIVASLSALAGGERGLLQVLFERVQGPWGAHALAAVQDGEGRSFFADAPEMLPLAREKFSRPLFAVVVRVAGKASTSERAYDIVRSLAQSLSVYEKPGSNGLIPLTNEEYPDPLHELDLLDRLSHRTGMLLSTAELSGLVHLPGASLAAEKLVRRARKTRACPETVRGGELLLGTNVHEGETRSVALSSDQRSRHVYVVGASGTGKSTLLLRLILQDIDAGRGVGVLDPHGDLVDQVLGRIPRERTEDVIVFDPSDAEYPVGFNVLSAHSELEKTLLSSDLVAAFRRLSTSWGDQMNAVLANAILAFLESDQGGTLADLRRFLIEPEFRRTFLATVRDPEIVYYWQKEFPLLSGKPQAPILTRLNLFLRPKLIRNMVAQKENRLDFAGLMNGQKIFLGKLSQGAIGEENAYLLGGFLVAKFQQAALSRQELAETARRPFYLYIDEFHNFITPSVAGILSGARKYRLSLTLAHQDLRQLSVRDPEVLASVLTNPYTRVCFRVGDQDAKNLAEGFASFDRSDLQSLGTGQAIVRVERADYDFTLDTAPIGTVNEIEAETRRSEVLEASRAKYGRARAEVESHLRVDTKSPEEASRERPALPVGLTPLAPPAVVTSRPPTPRPVEVRPPSGILPPEEAVSGRGGAQHRYLQELIKRWAEAHSFRATLEERVLDGLGNVDVALRKGERAIAVEISVSTEPVHEMENIQKCLAAGFERVVLVGVRKTLLRKVEQSLADMPRAERQRVSVITPEELFALLESLETEEAVREETLRGYRVRVKYRPGSEDEQRAKRQVVSDVVAKALQRIKD